DALLERRSAPRGLMMGVGGLGAVLAGFAVAVHVSAETEHGWWEQWLRGILERGIDTGELFFDAKRIGLEGFFRETAAVASHALLLAAITCAAAVVILFATRFRSVAIYGLILLAAVELFVFARATRAVMPRDVPFEQGWVDAIKQTPASNRILIVDPRYQN